MEKIGEKISNFALGDLVTIKPNHSGRRDGGTGIIVGIGRHKDNKQSTMFPECAVFDIKTSRIDIIYLYNLELLSPTQ